MNTSDTSSEKVQIVAVCCGLRSGGRAIFWGLVLIGLGGLGLLNLFVPLQPLGHVIWPVFLILAGGWVLLCCGRARS